MILSALERGSTTIPSALVGRQAIGAGTADQEGEAGGTLHQVTHRILRGGPIRGIDDEGGRDKGERLTTLWRLGGLKGPS